MSKLRFPHPGDILRDEYLAPMGISCRRLAMDTGVSRGRVTSLIHGRCSINADMAFRLARFFGATPRSWINLQTEYDLRMAEDAKRAEYAKIKVHASAA